MASRVAIVGAGHAGGSLAAMLRQFGFDGEIVILGEEPLPPYQRPPLSKAWLKGEVDGDSLALRPAAFYAEIGVDLRLDCSVAALDRTARALVLCDGQRISYDLAVLATGARPLRLPLPGADLDGVMSLRTAADADALKSRLAPGVRIAIVGGGYIGLEVAASAVALGAAPTVLEREARILARSASAPIAAFFTRYHRERGVRISVDANVTKFAGEAGRVTEVRLADGSVVACDVVLVGTGIAPNDDIARAAGLDCDRGVMVDAQCRSSDPTVYAIGDCTYRPCEIYGRMVRPESVPSALEQAKQAASHMTGRAPPAPEVPWNWSDQYALKLQVAGFPFDADEVVLRGNPAADSFAVFHLMQGRLRQVESVNAVPEFMAGRKLIQRQTPVDSRNLADPSVPMKEIAG